MRLDKQIATAFLCLTFLLPTGCMRIQDYRTDNQITVKQETVVLTVALDAKGQMTPPDESRLVDFVKGYITRGEDYLEVRALVPPEKKAIVLKRAEQLSKRLMEEGIEASRILIQPIAQAEEGREDYTVFLLSYKSWRAEVPECGDWGPHTLFSKSNQPSPNFGCAMQRNIGLMVANPKDLIEMSTPDGRNGRRAADIMNNYVRGAETRSDTEVESTLLSDSF